MFIVSFSLVLLGDGGGGGSSWGRATATGNDAVITTGMRRWDGEWKGGNFDLPGWGSYKIL